MLDFDDTFVESVDVLFSVNESIDESFNVFSSSSKNAVMNTDYVQSIASKIDKL